MRNLVVNHRAIAPGPKGVELLKVMLRLRKNPLDELVELQRSYGNVIRVKVPLVIHAVVHPDHVKHVLKENVKNYPKSRGMREFRPILGQGLITSEGELWRKQRRTVAREFHVATIKSFAHTMTEQTRLFLDSFDKREDPSAPIDVPKEMQELTLRIAGMVFFGTQFENSKIIANSVEIASQVAADRIRAVIKVPRWVPFPSHLKARKAVKNLDRIAYGLIHYYSSLKDEKKLNDHVLSKLIASRSKGSTQESKGCPWSQAAQKNPESAENSMDDRQLRDEIVTLLLAGHETTATTLSWALYCIGLYPEVQARLKEELNSVLANALPTYDHLEKLPYLKAVIQETLRLYPVVASLARDVLEDDEVGGYSIPAGSLMNCPQYLTHRLPEFWENPNQFDPDRFSPEKVNLQHPFAYYPFGRGPRACIGENFAIVESQLILAQILQRYTLSLLPGHPVKPIPRITLSSENGIKAFLKKETTI